MRQFLTEIRFAIVDAWKSRGGRKIAVDDSLARTLKEASHVSGGGGGAGAAGAAPRSAQVEQMVAGADNYVKSFDDGPR